MRLLVVSPATVGYRWEVEALVDSNKEFGVCDDVIWLTFNHDGVNDSDREASMEIGESLGIKVFYYEDDRPRNAYRTSVRPWMISKWLSEYHEYQSGTYFYADSDMVFTRPATFGEVSPSRWIGSQTDSYASPMISLSGAPTGTVVHLAGIVGVGMPDVARNVHNCPGAQWIICDPKPGVWLRVYEACEDVFEVLEDVYPVQSWFTDMYVTPWVLRLSGIEADADDSMVFSVMSSTLEDFHRIPIYHNALAPFDSASRCLFMKSDWREESPQGKHFEIEAGSASFGYVERLCRALPGTTLNPIG